MTKRIIKVVGVFFVILIAYFFGFYTGESSVPSLEKVQNVINKEQQVGVQADFNIFWDAWKTATDKYVDRKTLDPQAMVYGAVGGMVASLGDPYTSFFTPEQSKMLEDDINGSFSGIGAEIGFKNGALTIIAPLKDSPAEKAGIHAGDRIGRIDSIFTGDLSLEEAVLKIRGERSTQVVLSIMREGFDEPRDFTITRDVIRVPLVAFRMEQGGIAYIQLFNFLGNVDQEFQTIARQALAQGAKKIVLDLRNNPGGFLDSAIETASFFVPEGEIVAIEDFGNNGKKQNEFRSSGYRYFQSLPVVVLIDGGSASAAEIVAGALRDTRGVPLVGEKTFGKGSVQEVIDLANGTSIKITVAKWLTPSGASIHEQGIEPTVQVAMTAQDREEGRDPQLEKAFEIARNLK
ncbi:MAG: S41 family peptidase [Candidatus Azambacteria bacterium]|nr:S41 family peptidase [Candidatus Azambacteria bacterium]